MGIASRRITEKQRRAGSARPGVSRGGCWGVGAGWLAGDGGDGGGHHAGGGAGSVRGKVVSAGWQVSLAPELPATEEM